MSSLSRAKIAQREWKREIKRLTSSRTNVYATRVSSIRKNKRTVEYSGYAWQISRGEGEIWLGFLNLFFRAKIDRSNFTLFRGCVSLSWTSIGVFKIRIHRQTPLYPSVFSPLLSLSLSLSLRVCVCVCVRVLCLSLFLDAIPHDALSGTNCLSRIPAANVVGKVDAS